MKKYTLSQFIDLHGDKYFFDLIQLHIDDVKNLERAQTVLQSNVDVLDSSFHSTIRDYMVKIANYSDSNALLELKCDEMCEHFISFTREFYNIDPEEFLPVGTLDELAIDKLFKSAEDVVLFDLFMIYIYTIVFYAYTDSYYIEKLGARYGTFFLTRLIYNFKLHKKYILRFSSYCEWKSYNISKHVTMTAVNVIHPATIADVVYFKKKHKVTED